MANTCFYKMKIVGKLEDVSKCIVAMATSDKQNSIYGCDVHSINNFYIFMPGDITEEMVKAIIKDYAETEMATEIVGVEINGECRWSVQSSMMRNNGSGTTLKTLCKDLNLQVECYSEETSFQEHFIIGTEQNDTSEIECRSFLQMNLEDIRECENDGTLEILFSNSETAEEFGVTKDNYHELLTGEGDESELRLGGWEKWDFVI